jgi:hypothetical protein
VKQKNHQIGKVVPVLVEMVFPIALIAVDGGSGVELF